MRVRWGFGFAVAAIAATIAWWVLARGVEYRLGRFSFECRQGLESDPSGENLRGQDFRVSLFDSPHWVAKTSSVVVDGVDCQMESVSCFAPVAGGTPGRDERDHDVTYWFPSLGAGITVYYRTFGGRSDVWRDSVSSRWASRVFSTLRIERE